MVEDVFKQYTKGGAEMEGRDFVKLCKDTKLTDKSLTATDVDLIFAKVKSKGARKITLPEFEKALGFIAEKKKISVDDVKAKVSASSGPILSGTKPDEVRFHDDKSTYTGVHQNGGPSTIDKANMKDISGLCDRTAADVRGRKA